MSYRRAFVKKSGAGKRKSRRDLRSLSLAIAVASLFGGGARADTTKLPLAEVEPPRFVAASEWRSPYCGEWTDGCATCTRKTAGEAPTCQTAAGECRRRPIICRQALDAGQLARVCRNYFVEYYFDFRADDDRIATYLAYAKSWRTEAGGKAAPMLAYMDFTRPLATGGYVNTEPFVFEPAGPRRAREDEKPALPLTLRGSGVRCWRSWADGAPGGEDALASARLAGPPVTPLELKDVQPQRAPGPVAQWSSAFCRQWDDGCERCERDGPNGRPECGPIAKEVAACKPRAVLCRQVLSLDVLTRTCRTVLGLSWRAAGNQTVQADATPRVSLWTLRDDAKWEASLWASPYDDKPMEIAADGAVVQPAAKRSDEPRGAPEGHAYYCASPFAREPAR